MEILGVHFAESDIYLLGAGGVLVMALAYPRINDWQHRRGKSRDAVHTYKSAFADCVSAISNNSFAIDTFSRDFDRHQAAVDTIRPILSKRHQRKLQKAWNEYCGKGTGLGFDDKGFIESSSATVYFTSDPTNRKLFDDFKKRFHALHGCLDDLL